VPRQEDVNGPADKIGRPVLSLPGPVLSLPGIFFMPECDMTIRLGHWQQVASKEVFQAYSMTVRHVRTTDHPNRISRAPRQAVVTLRRIIF